MSPTLNRQNSIRFYQILAVISESESTWNELSDGYTHGTQKFEHKIATLTSFVMVHENCTEKHGILITQGFSSQTELDPWLSYHHKGNCKVSWNSNGGIWRKGLMPWFTKPAIAAALLRRLVNTPGVWCGYIYPALTLGSSPPSQSAPNQILKPDFPHS